MEFILNILNVTSSNLNFWTFVVQTFSILYKHSLTVSAPPFSAGGQPTLSILKRGHQKKMSGWEVLKCPCQKILSKMKYGFEDSIFKCQFWPVLAKQPINVSFCDILVLLNHLNNVTCNAFYWLILWWENTFQVFSLCHYRRG